MGRDFESKGGGEDWLPPSDAELQAAIQRVEKPVRCALRDAGASPADVDDLVQVTVMRLLRTNRFTDPSVVSIVALAISTARNVLTDLHRHSRAAKRDGSTSHFLQSFHSSAGEAAEEEYVGDEIVRCIERALSSLSDIHRQVFILEEVWGLGVPEIAIRLGLSESQVLSRLKTAHLRCHREIAAWQEGEAGERPGNGEGRP